MTERRLDHLDPATIAALVERTLTAEERAAAEAHLAVCGDCREVWVETSELEAETREITTMGKAHDVTTAARPISRRWIYAGAAIAATVVIGAAVSLLRPDRTAQEPSLDLLMQLTDGRRFAEARTSVEIAWQPRPSPMRGNDRPPSRAAQETLDALHTAARSQSTADSFHRAGLASLIVGRPDEAVSMLEAAARLGGRSVDLDLSAALLEKCRLSCRDEDRRGALAATERVLALSSDSAPALFNRALALEVLGRPDEARRAWQDALLRQGDAGWRAEVAGRIERLRAGGIQ